MGYQDCAVNQKAPCIIASARESFRPRESERPWITWYGTASLLVLGPRQTSSRFTRLKCSRRWKKRASCSVENEGLSALRPKIVRLFYFRNNSLQFNIAQNAAIHPGSEGNNKESGYKSLTYAYVFLFYSQTSCLSYLYQHMDFVEEGSINKFILSLFSVSIIEYALNNGYFRCPSVWKAIFRLNNTMNDSRNFTVSIRKSYSFASGRACENFRCLRGLEVLSKPNSSEATSSHLEFDVEKHSWPIFETPANVLICAKLRLRKQWSERHCH